MKLIHVGTSLAVLLVLLAPSSAQKTKPEDGADEDRVYSAKEVTRKAVIQEKAEANSTSECPDRGVDRVRVVLHKSGKVTEVKFLRKMSCGFDESVKEAVSKIRFTPAVKDGVAVSQYAVLEYSYTRY